VGKPFSLSVTAAGTAPLFYQWYKGDAPLSGANLPTYTIESVQPSDAGFYRCTVSNRAGHWLGDAISDPAVLTIAPDPDTTKPVISLLGAADASLEVGSPYTDAGATASDDRDGDITPGVVVTGSVDTAVLGDYTLTYNVSDAAGNAADPVTRVLHVVDTTKPVITLQGLSDVIVEAGTAYADAGADAADNYYGNLTSRIARTGSVNTGAVGVYTLTYNVSDDSGNAADPATRTVHVVDTTKPVITLLGPPSIKVQAGSTYSDAGATAADSLDGSITSRIVRSGSVNTAALGTYVLTFNVSDATGNAAAPVARTVYVVDTVRPVITLVGAAELSTPVGSPYSDAGATAADSFDGNITRRIAVTGSVNIAVLGTYSLTFKVSDAAGNAAAPVIRTVRVVDAAKPAIALLGPASVTVQVGDSYVDAGATANDNYDGDITSRIVVANTVNTMALGNYTVTYTVSDNSGNAAVPVARTVHVVDTTKPVITRLGDDPVTVNVFTPYTDAGATATDNYDGNITPSVVTTGTVNTSVRGTYYVYYGVKDSSGNEAAKVMRTVHVVDPIKPVITRHGASAVWVKLESAYVDAGATATDNYDGDLTSKIVVTNGVNTLRRGIYKVRYNVVDSSGNAAATVTRRVVVH
jgi:hypothetical protein